MSKIYTIILCVAAFILAADQGTKQKAIETLANEGSSLPFLSWFHFTLVHNHGVAFGMFRDLPEAGRVWMLNALTITILTFLWFSIVRKFKPSDRIGPFWIGLVFGGALGNFIDRTRLGYVIDFIDWAYPSVTNKCIPLFDAQGDGACHWPVFNIADSAIVCAMVIAFVSSYWHEKNSANAQ